MAIGRRAMGVRAAEDSGLQWTRASKLETGAACSSREAAASPAYVCSSAAARLPQGPSLPCYAIAPARLQSRYLGT